MFICSGLRDLAGRKSERKEDFSVNKTANKFAFSLVFVYLCLLKKVFYSTCVSLSKRAIVLASTKE